MTKACYATVMEGEVNVKAFLF